MASRGITVTAMVLPTCPGLGRLALLKAYGAGVKAAMAMGARKKKPLGVG